MDDIHLFLAHAIQLEFDAVRRYEDLRAAMGTAGNTEAQAFFARMAEFSRLHLRDALRRGGFREIPKLEPDQWEWPEGVSPEQAAWAGVDGFVDAPTAYRLALDGEERSQLFYAAIVATTTDPEVRRMAREFATEEAEHVAELEKLMARLAA
jgi:rubrerythrin